jgi:hypothetical protein
MIKLALKLLNKIYYKLTDWPMPEYCNYLWNNSNFTFPTKFNTREKTYDYVKDYANFVNKREIVQIYTETTQERKRQVLLKFVREAEKSLANPDNL